MIKLISQTLKDAKQDVATSIEDIFDLASDNEVLDQVPIVNYAVKVLNIRDHWHTNKLKRNYLAFIRAVAELNPDEISEYEKVLGLGGEIGTETAETIFEIILDSEKPLKAELIGRLSVALARGKVSLVEYNTIALIIQSSSVAAIRALPSFLMANNFSLSKNGPGAIPEEGLLFSLGIATRFGSGFSINDLGRNIAIHGFGLENIT